MSTSTWSVLGVLIQLSQTSPIHPVCRIDLVVLHNYLHLHKYHPIDIIIKIFGANITNVPNSITVDIRLICIGSSTQLSVSPQTLSPSISLSKSGQASPISPIPSLQCRLICVRIIYTIIYISTSTISIDIIIKIFRAAIKTSPIPSLSISNWSVLGVLTQLSVSPQTPSPSISLSTSSGQLSQTSPIPSLSQIDLC